MREGEERERKPVLTLLSAAIFPLFFLSFALLSLLPHSQLSPAWYTSRSPAASAAEAAVEGAGNQKELRARSERERDNTVTRQREEGRKAKNKQTTAFLPPLVSPSLEVDKLSDLSPAKQQQRRQRQRQHHHRQTASPHTHVPRRTRLTCWHTRSRKQAQYTHTHTHTHRTSLAQEEEHESRRQMRSSVREAHNIARSPSHKH